jgi:hypothetical protein
MNRVAREFCIFVALAAAVALAQALVTFDPAAITDWRGYGLALLGSLVREGAKAALSWFAARRVSDAYDDPKRFGD